MKQHRLWVLLIDGSRARILRDLDPADRSASPELLLRAPQDELRRIMTDRTDPPLALCAHDRAATQARLRALHTDAATFAAEVAGFLEAHRLSGMFDHLAIYSSPDMLGLLRERLTTGLRRCVVREEARHLLHLPHHDAVDFLRDHIVNGQVIRLSTPRAR